MDKNLGDKRKLLSLGIILIAILLLVVIAVNVLNKGNKISNQENIVAENIINYTTTTEGNKVNTSEEVASDKKVENILIEKSAITYENGTSKLTSKVTNDSIAKDNLRFNVKFLANDGSTIAQSVGFVGSIKENEVKYIDSSITVDVSNAKNITYEVIK